MDIILGSSSKYRRQLLDQIGISVQSISPDIDETAFAGETCEGLARRLAAQKADAVANQVGTGPCIIIASDQVADFDGKPVGKPGNHSAALEQLLEFSGNQVTFHTAFTLLKLTKENTRQYVSGCQHTQVVFRTLTATEIEHYLKIDQPYDCAGSFKVEGLGISLFEAINSDDPTGLVGLPLIYVNRALEQLGYNLLDSKVG